MNFSMILKGFLEKILENVFKISNIRYFHFFFQQQIYSHLREENFPEISSFKNKKSKNS